MSHYTLGLVSISFRDKSPLEIVQAVRAAGLSCIEWGSDVHAPCGDIQRLTEIAALQREYGIACSSYGTYFFLGQTPIEELNDYVRAAKILGTDTIRLWCGKKSGADMTDDEREQLIAECRKAARIAEENQVTFCMECHRDTYTDRPENTVSLMEAVEEAITIARAGSGRLQISHLKTSGPKNWGKIDAVFGLIEKARAEGMNVHADRYPYIYFLWLPLCED